MAQRKAERIVTSKNKMTVLAWAKRVRHQYLWKDDNEVWHAAKDINNLPFHAIKIEEVK